MPKIQQVEPDVAVAPQLAEADFAVVAARGFRSVVAIRPDGEAPDQLANARAAAAAKRHGLAFSYLPVMSVAVTDAEVVDRFARLRNDLPGPILFYCGTGVRCMALWAQTAAPRLGIEAALAAARNAGHDLDILRDTLAERVAWQHRATAPESMRQIAACG